MIEYFIKNDELYVVNNWTDEHGRKFCGDEHFVISKDGFIKAYNEWINKTSTEEVDHFPAVIGAPIEMFVDGIWKKGVVINGYRFDDGIVTAKMDDGQTWWCGTERTDLYRKPEE